MKYVCSEKYSRLTHREKINKITNMLLFTMIKSLLTITTELLYFFHAYINSNKASLYGGWSLLYFHQQCSKDFFSLNLNPCCYLSILLLKHLLIIGWAFCLHISRIYLEPVKTRRGHLWKSSWTLRNLQ